MRAAKPTPPERPPISRRPSLLAPVRQIAGTRRTLSRPPAPRAAAERSTARRAPSMVRGSRHRYVAAGHILGVGLVCFGLWLFLDARQLYTNAVASPPGVRRSASMDLLGPIARVEELFGLDRIVNGANRGLGRAGAASEQQTLPKLPAAAPPGRTTTGAKSPSGAATPPARATAGLGAALGVGVALKAPWDPFGAVPSGQLLAGSSVLVASPWDPFRPAGEPPSALGAVLRTGGSPGTSSSPATTPTVGPTAKPSMPPLVTPTPARPLSVLEIGDSLGVDLGYGLEDVLGNSPSIHLRTKAVIDTGLANVAYYNWPATLEEDLRKYHPGLVVIMVGGNDTQNFLVGNEAALFGTPFWRQQYGMRVELMMREAVDSGARVVWVGMPQMASGAPVTSAQMSELDAVYEAEAAKVPGVLYLPTWRLLANSKGAYSTFLPDASGSLVAVRDPDGVHLDYPAGDDLVAQAIVSEVRKAWSVSL